MDAILKLHDKIRTQARSAKQTGEVAELEAIALDAPADAGDEGLMR